MKTAGSAAGESSLATTPQEELALLTQDTPMRLAMLGTPPRHRCRSSVVALAGCTLANGTRRTGSRPSSPPAVARACSNVLRSSLRLPMWPWSLRGRREKGGMVTADKATDEVSLDANPEEELALLTQASPMRVAMLGSRECPFQHQQEIELLSEARVSRGDHVYTSGSSGTNSSVIRGALQARRPRLLTVVLPQSFDRQDEESQALLRKCLQAGVTVQPTPANDRLSLPEAARACNTKVLGRVQKLIAIAPRESLVYLDLVDEAKQNGIVTTRFFLD